MRPRAQSSHGRGFGAQAEVYDEVRPGYPAAALDLAGSDWQGMRVCDLGAGTGILSRELLARGCEVLAVDPDPAALARNQAPKRIGTAEDTGSEAAAFDLVTVAQAWHWFDEGPQPPRSHASSHRAAGCSSSSTSSMCASSGC